MRSIRERGEADEPGSDRPRTRAVSAIVNADVTVRPRVRIDFSASASCSSSAATRALDSMYRTPASSAAEGAALAQRFATIGVDQVGGSSRGKPNVRPPFCRVTAFDWRANHSGGNEFVETARRALRPGTRRDQLCDYTAMSRDRNTFPGLNPPNSGSTCLSVHGCLRRSPIKRDVASIRNSQEGVGGWLRRSTGSGASHNPPWVSSTESRVLGAIATETRSIPEHSTR